MISRPTIYSLKPLQIGVVGGAAGQCLSNVHAPPWRRRNGSGIPKIKKCTLLWHNIEKSAVPHPQNQRLTDLKSAKLPQFNVKVWKMGYNNGDLKSTTALNKVNFLELKLCGINGGINLMILIPLMILIIMLILFFLVYWLAKEVFDALRDGEWIYTAILLYIVYKICVAFWEPWTW